MKLRLPTALLIVGALASTLAIVYVSWIGYRLAQSDIASIRGDEQYFVSGVVKILSGAPLYSDPSAPPYLLTGYTPAAYYLTVCSAKAFGTNDEPLHTTMRVGRMLGLVLSVFHLALLFALLRRCFNVRLAFAIIACGIAFAIRMPWGFVVRPDPLFSLLFLASFGLIVIGFDRRWSPRAVAAITALAGIAASALFWTKQTGIQIPVIALSYFILTMDWRRLGAFAAGFAVPTLAAILAFPYLFGDAWATSMFLTNASGLNFGNAIRKVFIPAMLRAGGVLMILFAIPAWIAWAGRNSEPRLRFLAWATIGAIGFSFLTAFSSGAAAHYFNDSLTLVLMCLAAHWGATPASANTEFRRHQWIDCAAGAYATLFLPLFLFPYAGSYLQLTDRLESRAAVRAELGDLLERNPNTQFLTVDNALANYFPDRAVVPQFLYASIFWNNGAVDLSALQAQLDDGRVGVCLVGANQDLARQLSFLGLTGDHFVKDRTLDGFAFWVYRNPLTPADESHTR